MAGTKRGLDDGHDFGYGDDANADSIDHTAIQATGHRDTDGPLKKRPRKYTAQSSPAGATSCSRPFVDPTLLPSPGTDFLSPLSDELLVRILGNLSMTDLLSLAPVSRRFHRLADDSQLWKAIYYERFVLPRALRFPGFRGGSLNNSTKTTSAGNIVSRLEAYAEQRLGGAQPEQASRNDEEPTRPEPLRYAGRQARDPRAQPGVGTKPRGEPKPNWKQQYRLRHNWAKGQCAVEELRLGNGRSGDDGLRAPSRSGREGEADEDEFEGEDEDGDGNFYRILVKVVDGIAVTADRKRGLRVWELKSRSLVAAERLPGRSIHAEITEKATETVRERVLGIDTEGSMDSEHEVKEHDGTAPLIPTSLAIDLNQNTLDIAIGLLDGGFEIWQYELVRKTLVRRFSHPASSSGPLTGIAYSYPYVLTATDDGLISLYAFGAGRKPVPRTSKLAKTPSCPALNAPLLLTSLRSHTSQPPLALSIRKLSSVAIASIAYTISTRQGWSIGIQDLHVKEERPDENKETGGRKSGPPTVVATRLAHTLPVTSHGRAPSSANVRRRAPDGSFSSSLRTRTSSRPSLLASPSDASPPFDSPPRSVRVEHQPPRQDDYDDGRADDGPISLCYTHPYLLATMPDNTLILHLCTSNASTLAISSGIRLWGHTSGISDAEITARGKAVSVSMRGEEMRVWELEGRPAAERGRSVAIRPSSVDAGLESLPAYDWDERRNWVGFDDEMVIVLKEARGGRESLMVYDFT